MLHPLDFPGLFLSILSVIFHRFPVVRHYWRHFSRERPSEKRIITSYRVEVDLSTPWGIDGVQGIRTRTSPLDYQKILSPSRIRCSVKRYSALQEKIPLMGSET